MERVKTKSTVKSESMLERPSAFDKKNTRCSSVKCLNISVVCVAMFLGGATLSLIAPFYSKEAEKHKIPVWTSGLVFGSVYIFQIFLTPLFGKYIHVIGKEIMFLVGVFVCGLTTVLFGALSFVRTKELYLVISLTLRTVTAIGESAMNTSIYPLAWARCSEKSKITALSVVETMASCGTTFGPFIGGLLFEYAGFHAPFSVCGSLLLICGVLLLITIFKAQTFEEINELQSISSSPTRNMTFYQLMSSPSFKVASISTVVAGISSQWYQPSLEPYIRTQFGLGVFESSLLFVIDGAVYAVASPITGKLIDIGFLGSRMALVMGSLFACFGFLLLAPAPPFDFCPSLYQISIGAGLHGIGMALNFIGSLTLMMKEVKRDNDINSEQLLGMVTSVWITCEWIGSSMGGSLGGITYDRLGWSYSCKIVALLQIATLFTTAVNCCLFSMKAKRNETRKEVKNNSDTSTNLKQHNYGSIRV